MAASVPFAFVPPISDSITTLFIWEGPSSTGPFVEIDSTPSGNFPNYITEYTTNNAISNTDWFAIQWGDASGNRGELSAPIQGGTTTLIGDIIERVMLRNSAFNENIISEEAEGVVSFVYNVTDPYSIALSSVDYLWLTSLAKLTLISCLYMSVVQTLATGATYSAGIISATSPTSKDTLDALERQELRILARLGIGGSRLARLDHRGSRKSFSLTGAKEIVEATRLLQVKSIITEHIMVQDEPTGFVISRR